MTVAFRQTACSRLLVVGLAVLVFALAWQAKLSLYDPPHTGSVNPISASKLWLNGQKLKVSTTGVLPMLWLATLFLFSLPARHDARQEDSGPATPRHLGLQELYRFLRPPPVIL
jgi:hypothetical protein